MVAVPFFYFSFLAITMYLKRRIIDIPIMICMIYGLSGFLSIFVERFNLSAHPSYHVSFLACIAYCSLLTISLLPFMTFSNCLIRDIRPFNNEKLLKRLAWLAFWWFMFTAIMSWSQFYGVMTGDMGELRQALYDGTAEAGFMTKLPGPLRIILTIFNMFFGCGWVHIFLAFFCLTIQKLPKKYFFLFLISSLCGPWTSILGVDRSGIAIYILSFVSVYVFFWSFLETKIRKRLFVLIAILFGFLIFYLSAMTFARFGGIGEDDTERVNNSLIYYLGSCYLEFSYFFDNVDNPDKCLNLIFPFISKFLLGRELIGGVMLNQAIELKTGVFTGVFLTYLGQIQLTAGFPVTLLFCFAVYYFANRFLSPISKRIINAKVAFLYLMFAEIMVLGQYSYYYQTPTRTFSVVFFIYFINIMSYKKRNAK